MGSFFILKEYVSSFRRIALTLQKDIYSDAKVVFSRNDFVC